MRRGRLVSRSARREGHRDAARSGRAGVLGLPARVRPRLRDRDVRAGARARGRACRARARADAPRSELPAASVIATTRYRRRGHYAEQLRPFVDGLGDGATCTSSRAAPSSPRRATSTPGSSTSSDLPPVMPDTFRPLQRPPAGSDAAVDPHRARDPLRAARRGPDGAIRSPPRVAIVSDLRRSLSSLAGRHVRKLAALRRPWVVVLALTFLGGVVGMLWESRQPPSYTSSAAVLLAPMSSYVDLDPDNGYPPQVSIDTDARLANSDVVVARVVDRTGSTAREVREAMSIAAPPSSTVLRLSYTASSPIRRGSRRQFLGGLRARRARTRSRDEFRVLPDGPRSRSRARAERAGPWRTRSRDHDHHQRTGRSTRDRTAASGATAPGGWTAAHRRRVPQPKPIQAIRKFRS